MGLTFRLGQVPLAIFTDSSNNVGIGAAANASFKLQVTGATNLTGALTGAGATFSGNVGIGATLSAWISSADVLQLNNTSALYAPTDESILSNNVFVDSGDNNKYITTNFASQYRQVSGQHLFYSAASGTAGNTISFGTPKLAITSGGNVGIGTSSPNATAANRTVLDLNGSLECLFAFSNGGTLRGYIYHNASTSLYVTEGARNMEFSTTGAGFMGFGTNNTERMRITSGGEVLMNTSSTLTAGWLCIAVASDNYNAIVLKDTGTSYSAGNYYQLFTNSSNTLAGSISHNTITGVNFNTSSDYRLKEDFKDFNGLEILSNIKFYNFKWKEDDKRMHGVIAHELESLIPLAVSGTKDAIDEEGNIVAQGVDYSKIVPILGKAIQELEARIKQLENK